jgi:pimeloyl-ACP methyl ester carboxylesterase
VVEPCDHLGQDRFDLVANNTGGAVTQHVAAHLSDQLSTLTLTNCDTEGNTLHTPFIPVTVAGRLVLLARMGSTARCQPPGLMFRGLTADYPHPGCAALSSVDLATVRPQLAQLKLPALIAWATGDVFFPLKCAPHFSDVIPDLTEVAALDGVRMHFAAYRAGEFLPLLQQHWAHHCE